MPARETITIPPNGKQISVCPLWPDCDCEADCTAGTERASRVQWVMFGLMSAVALIGAGLIYAGLR
ncbi:hypothetical protein EB232_17925 [Mesorhizobium sp. NZP2077]|nr:hypothetical protein EB232_17925 [Mesorhizobium sp. NZP2077]